MAHYLHCLKGIVIKILEKLDPFILRMLSTTTLTVLRSTSTSWIFPVLRTVHAHGHCSGKWPSVGVWALSVIFRNSISAAFSVILRDGGSTLSCIIIGSVNFWKFRFLLVNAANMRPIYLSTWRSLQFDWAEQSPGWDLGPFSVIFRDTTSAAFSVIFRDGGSRKSPALICAWDVFQFVERSWRIFGPRWFLYSFASDRR